MAALLNPTVRRLALAACRRHPTPAAAAEPLVPHCTSQARYNSNLVKVDDGGFGEMVASGSPRYYVMGGKGGVGKTSMAASLAVKLANRGEPTLIVSTVPHSLADSFEQDMGGGKIVPVSGVDSLFATEIGHMEEENLSYLSWIHGIISRTKLGAIVDPNALHEMLHKVPGVFSEFTAIAQLIISVEESNNFKRIVLDTVTTQHILHLLRGINWMEKSFDLLIKAMSAISSDSAVESTIGKDKLNSVITKLEETKQMMGRATKLFHDPQSVEFVIVTIPTVMAVNESSRFHASLKKDGVLEETRALNMISNDCELGGLKLIKAQLLDVEPRGVPGLKFFGDAVWK